MLIENKLKDAGTVITSDLAKEIAVAIRNPMWDWHIYLGFALGALLVCRILIAIFVEKKCPGMHAFKSALGLKNLPANEKAKGLHYTLVKISYAVFYLVTFLMVITGLMLNFKDQNCLSKETIGSIKEIHDPIMCSFVPLSVVQILGIIMDENKQDSTLVSDMINERGMIDLRGASSDKKFMAAAKSALSLDLPKQPRTSAAWGDIRVFWLSPDQWLITCPRAKAQDLADGLAAELTGIHSLAVNVSDMRAIIRLEGEGVREVVMKGTAIDLTHE